MIDVNKVLEPDYNFNGFRSAGYRQVSPALEPDYNFNGFRSAGYRQVSPATGIKTAGNNWNYSYKTLAELRASYDWDIAQKEFCIQRKIASFGLAPKAISLTAAYNLLGMFVPCITMEHVTATTLCDAYVKYNYIDRQTAKEVLVDIQYKLAQNGYLHGDCHGDNILLVFDRSKKYITRELLIDFEYADRQRTGRIPGCKLESKNDHKEFLKFLEEDADCLLNDYDDSPFFRVFWPLI